MKMMDDFRNENIAIGYLLTKLSEAIDIARKVHEGQYDKAHQPYFMHPEAVSRIVSEIIRSQPEPSESFMIQAKIVSYLHDVIEDSSVTAGYLREKEIPEECVTAIEILTKKKGQDYMEYLSEIKRNKLARVVKIADMMHNSDLSRLRQITDVDRKRREKYLKGISFLSAQ
jgi:(p)ppGpp synthase/HD superfamily hydrolase